MRDYLRRLLITYLLEDGSDFGCDFESAILRPQGTHGFPRALVEMIAEKGLEFDAIMAHIEGGTALALATACAANIFADTGGTDTPCVLLYENRYITGTRNLTHSEPRVLLVEDAFLEGGRSGVALEYAREMGFEPVHLICVLAADKERVASFEEEYGVKVSPLFYCSDLVATEEDHILFVKDPNPNNTGYYYLRDGANWVPCTEEQNTILATREHVPYSGTIPTIQGIGAFYVKGVLKV